jgi:hypothetical protein
MTETRPGQPYLNDPVMNNQVAYDSEFYISIAIAGYDDPVLRTAPPDWREDLAGHKPVSLNYAFFPFYPLVMRALSSPLSLLGFSAIGTASLAGVIVSLLGTLGAMLALHDLTRDELEESGGIRTAFYLIAFPTGFFLAMVHTEGLFVGLAFGALALLRRKQWIGAALLAACATWTRAVGIALVIPLAVAWIAEVRASGFSLRPFPWKLLGKAAARERAARRLWRLAPHPGRQFRLRGNVVLRTGLVPAGRPRGLEAGMAGAGGGKPLRPAGRVQLDLYRRGDVAKPVVLCV